VDPSLVADADVVTQSDIRPIPEAAIGTPPGWGSHTEAEANVTDPASLWRQPSGASAEVAYDGTSEWAWSSSEVPQAILAPVPWGANQAEAGLDAGDSPAAIMGPAPKTLKFVQSVYFVDPGRLGITTWPVAYKVPKYDPNTSIKWYATPKLTTKADEGNSNAYFVPAGLHPTLHVEKGAPVFWDMSAAMAARDSNAELEHSRDFKYAYEISLKEAQKILDKHIVGKVIGPEASKVAAENKVKAIIAAKLTHKALGNDQTKWGAQYEMLQKKTLTRDAKLWHTFGLGNRKETKDKKGKVLKVTYKVNKGSTKIGVVKSKTIIKY
jgi:hypothetical protein